MFIAGFEDLLDSPLELFGRTSGHERFLRREKKTIGLAALYGRGRHVTMAKRYHVC
jgi:hypothetical protein